MPLKRYAKSILNCSTVVSVAGSFSQSEHCIVFVPGNPGIIEFYDIFLLKLHDLFKIPVVGIAQGGHSPAWEYGDSSSNGNYLDIEEQILHKVEYIKTELPAHLKLILIGHSIGAYIVLKMLEHTYITERVRHSILLFPAIEELSTTPNGRFWTPVSKYCRLPMVLLAFVFSFTPVWFKNMLVAWRAKGRAVDEKILKPCHSCVCSSLMNHAMYLASSEMDILGEMKSDMVALIQNHIEKLTFYYGPNDNWAPFAFYTRMTDRFPNADIRLCEKGFPHDFVLDSSEQVALVCSDILKAHNVL